MTTSLNAAEARRHFLKTGGSLVVTFAVGVPAMADAAVAPAMAPAKSVALDQVDGFLAIDAKGLVTVYSGKVDLGTGLETALLQIAAEELSIPMARVTIIQGDTLLTPDQGVTFGSLSIQVGGMQIRKAAATARDVLLTEAAKRLGVDKASLTVKDGIAMASTGGKGLAYGDLVADQDLHLKVDPKAVNKDPRDYTIVGKSVARLDIPGKVDGRFTYMQDFKRKGMVHARVVRPRAIKATLQAYDDSACRKIPGFVTTVRKGNFLAVVARNEWASIRASRAIVPQWSDWQGLPDRAKLWDYVRATKIVKDEDLQKVGMSGDALAAANVKPISATYDFAIHTHGSIGPSCAIAEFKDGKLTSWSASQQTHLLRKQLASMLALSADDIRCIYVEGAGCYGRNGHEDAAADAALISHAIGLPVRVQWMREDEHGWDPKGPPTLLDFKGALDASGNIVAWESDAFIPDRPKDIVVALVAAELADLPHQPSHPGNVQAALAIPYTVPNIRATVHNLAETPFRPSWIRSPGRMQNTFGNESFFDEMAIVAGVDPFEYRRRHLADARGLDALARLEKLSAWVPRSGPRVAQTGTVMKGRGVAYVKYELVRTYVGVVCDVEVDRSSGKVTAKRFFVTHDCGQIINPDGLRNQIEGNVVQTVSRTLIEQLDFDRSSVTSLDWASYPILHFPDVPEVVMELIDRPAEVPWGAGEPTAAVVPAAIANAVFDATGVRLRSVPFLPEKVLAGLKTV